MRSIPCCVLLGLLFTAAAQSQNGPFLFTVTPDIEKASSAYIHYDAAYGRETFEPFAGEGIEQNVGIRADLGTLFTFSAKAGMAVSDRSPNTSQQAELLAHIMRGEDQFLHFSAGAGVRHEYSGTNVMLGRIVLGRSFSSWQLYGNLLFEKPLSANRDNIDLISTVGMSCCISPVVRLGFEAVGQDLEGFWDENEAEGGATLYAGPVVGLAVPGSPWNFSLGGGMIMRGSQSSRASGAVRDLPAGQGNGFIIRTMISLAL